MILLLRKSLIVSILLICYSAFAQVQTKLDAALRVLESQAEQNQLVKSDLSDLVISDQYQTDHNGVQHFYFQQRYQGIPIYNAITSVHIAKDGKVYDSPNRFVGKISQKVNTTKSSISASTALEASVRNLEIPNALIPANVAREDENGISYFDKTNFTNGDIPVKMVYKLDQNQNLILCYEITLDLNYKSAYWVVFVNAKNAQILDKVDKVIHCNFDHKHQNCQQHQAYQNTKQKTVKQELVRLHSPTRMPNSYNILALPVESPLYGNRSIVTDPADPVASPFGWHDTNGLAGPEFTVTSGNNVNAYLDRNGDNTNDGNQPNGGSSLIFDFPMDLTKEPLFYQNAAVTNLFYINNMMHDILYNFGFDEKAGNFQTNNYAKGGKGGDQVNAEAQDGSGLNNANFLTPADGGSGRMQMFLWSSSLSEVTITAPSSLEGTLDASRGGFGPAPTTTPIEGDAVWSDDGTPGKERLGCNNSQNKSKISGKIVVIERGECDFSQKAYFAQNGGAIAVLICSHNNTNVNMGAGDFASDVKIPTYYMTKATCDKIRVQIDNGLKVKIKKPEDNSSRPDSLDGDLDNGIITHEYGHGVSNRLTGGPSNSGCLGNSEQMGEGWSDFMSLIMTAEPLDKGTDVRGIGNYAINSKKDGLGIRRKPYTTDKTVNNFTYKNIGTETHDIGEVWALVLWDLYWAFAEKYGYDPSFKNKTAGNNICIQLVMDGMKLQPCSPGFIDGRNAILKADEINNKGVNKCLIWQVFADRGMGFGASQGNADQAGDEIEDFEALPECVNATRLSKTVDQLVNAGDAFEVTLAVRNLRATGVNNVEVSDEIPDGCSYVSGSASLAPTTITGNKLGWSLSSMTALQNTVIKYKLKTDPNIKSNTLFIDNLDDPFTEDFYDLDLKKGNSIWLYDGSQGVGGSACYTAEESSDTTDFYFWIKNPVQLSGNEPSFFFQHYYNTQASIDAGMVEFSTDGKVWQAVKSTDFSLNGYDGEIDYSTFAIPFAEGFSGYSKGFKPSVVNLTQFSGQKVQFRFRFGTDMSVVSSIAGFKGWIVDNFEFINPKFYNSQACMTTGLGENVCLSASGKGTLVNSNKVVGTENVNSTEFRAYPNPAHDKVFVFIKDGSDIHTINIKSVDGKLIRSYGNQNWINQQLEISTTDLAKGLVVIEAVGAKQNTTRKLLIQ